MSNRSSSQTPAIASLIPGYSSYRALESRRDDDRLTRSFLVKRIDECKNKLDSLGVQAIQSGDFSLPLTIEKYRTQLDLARSRLAASVEGYAGWFSSRTIDEKVLQQVANQDANLVSVVDLIGQLLNSSALAHDKLTETIDLLHQRIDRRSELLKQS